MSNARPDPGRRVRREVIAALAGLEAGAGVGIVVFGGRALAPLVLAACGALTGPLLAVGARRLRLLLFGWRLRAQLRAAAPRPTPGASTR
jgi:hypothetical protein